jgi:hypothetical protein
MNGEIREIIRKYLFGGKWKEWKGKQKQRWRLFTFCDDLWLISWDIGLHTYSPRHGFLYLMIPLLSSPQQYLHAIPAMLSFLPFPSSPHFPFCAFFSSIFRIISSSSSAILLSIFAPLLGSFPCILAGAVGSISPAFVSALFTLPEVSSF